MNVLHLWRALVTSRWTIPALFMAGALLRIIWVAAQGLEFFEAEAGNVARAIALGRGIADPYFPGSGPTAHLLPTMPVIAGAILTLFGAGTWLSAVVLLTLALVQMLVITLLILRLFRLLGASTSALIGAVAFSMLVPVAGHVEAFAFRAWDNGLVFIATLLVLIDQVRVILLGSGQSRFAALRPASLLAIAAFLNPLLGAALAIGVFLSHWRGRGLAHGVAVGVATVMIFAGLTAPWLQRNVQVLGAPIVSRSNAGLELAMANHDAALHAQDSQAVFDARHLEVHPFRAGPGRAAYRRMGEVAYYQDLQRQTLAWIAAHPFGFAQLCFSRVFRTLTPQPWQIGMTAGRYRAIVMAVVCWSGIAALVFLAIREKRSPWWILALFLGSALIAYSPFQPTDRYIYPFYQLLMFSAATGIASFASRGLGLAHTAERSDVVHRQT